MSKLPNLPSPPTTLGPAGKRLWRDVMQVYDLDAHALHLLRAACEQSDRAEQARKIVAEQGMVQTDRFGQTKTHPAVEIERQAALASMRLLRELGLDLAVPESRPPRRAGTGR